MESTLLEEKYDDTAESIQKEFHELMDVIKEARPNTFNYQDAFAIAVYRKLAQLEQRIDSIKNHIN